MRRDSGGDLAAAVILTVVMFVAFSPVLNHEFTLYDDTSYVTENPMVLAGLTWQGLLWAFTTMFTGIWHPLTWVSHMAVVELFGVNPMWHHLVNLILHIANTVLLFLVLRSMTGLLWQSGVVAALFALHPLHVESVAWVAERKDVLSAMFWMLTTLAYVRYVRDPGLARYMLVVLAFVLGLLAKPMVVTLPFVLLLLDYWPLGRLDRSSMSWAAIRAAVWNKIPLFGLAAVASGITLYAERSGGNVTDVTQLPVSTRVAHALVAYVAYLEKTVWPHDLAALYPLSASVAGGLSPGRILAAGLLILAITGFVVVFGARRRYLPVGWFWFLGTLIPVIGLVQFGHHAMADRFTYIPLIGLFIAAVWGLSDLCGNHPARRGTLAVAGAGTLIAAALVTNIQVRYWRDTVTLFEHALAVTPANRVAHLQLGAAYGKLGRYEDAAAQFHAALALKPNSVEASNNLGIVLAQAGKPEEAAASFRAALRLNPDNASLHANLARTLRQTGAIPEALDHYREALRLDPASWSVAMNLAWILATDADATVRRPLEAVVLAEEADRRMGHTNPRTLDTLAAAYASAGQYEKATETAQRAISAALRSGDRRLAENLEARMVLYRSRRPYQVVRTAPSPPGPNSQP